MRQWTFTYLLVSAYMRMNERYQTPSMDISSTRKHTVHMAFLSDRGKWESFRHQKGCFTPTPIVPLKKQAPPRNEEIKEGPY